MHINKPYILVRINKSAQTERKEKEGSIYLPQRHMGMTRNLQHGEVVQIGETAAKYHPEVQIGDTALFTHFIEEEPWRVVDRDANGDEYRVIDCRKETIEYSLNYELFGVEKKDGSLVAAYHHIICDTNTTAMVKKDFLSNLILTVDSAIWEDDELLRQKIEDLDGQKHSIEQTLASTKDPYHFEKIEKDLDRINKERRRITAFMNRNVFVFLQAISVNPRAQRDLGVYPGDNVIMVSNILYDLDYKGKKYKLAFTDHLIGKYVAANKVA